MRSPGFTAELSLYASVLNYATLTSSNWGGSLSAFAPAQSGSPNPCPGQFCVAGLTTQQVLPPAMVTVVQIGIGAVTTGHAVIRAINVARMRAVLDGARASKPTRITAAAAATSAHRDQLIPAPLAATARAGSACDAGFFSVWERLLS